VGLSEAVLLGVFFRDVLALDCFKVLRIWFDLALRVEVFRIVLDRRDPPYPSFRAMIGPMKWPPYWALPALVHRNRTC
jgi:hypothetical protein